jgi:hypothetical protein
MSCCCRALGEPTGEPPSARTRKPPSNSMWSEGGPGTGEDYTQIDRPRRHDRTGVHLKAKPDGELVRRVLVPFAKVISQVRALRASRGGHAAAVVAGALSSAGDIMQASSGGYLDDCADGVD